MSAIQVDDIDPAILYSGTWQKTVSSTRQWGLGTVHTTTETGASATITFRGTRIMMYCSLPIGIGSEIVKTQLDGGQVSSSTHASSTVTASYNQVWFDSGLLGDAVHTLVVSNGGGPSDTPFELDRFTVFGFVLPPSPSSSVPPALSPTVTTPNQSTTPIATPTVITDGPSSLLSPEALAMTSMSVSSSSETSSNLFSTANSLSGGAVTVTGVQYITTTALDGSVSTYIPSTPAVAESHSAPAPIGAIIGGAIGGLSLVFLLILLLLLCLRRRRNAWRHVILDDDAEKHLNPRPRTPTGVTPFRLDENPASSSTSAVGSRDFSHEMEIATAGLRYILASGSAAASPTLPSPMGLGSTEKSRSASSSHSHSPTHSAHSTRFPHVNTDPHAAIGSNVSSSSIISALSSMYASAMPGHPQLNTNDTPPSYQIATSPLSDSPLSSPLSSRP